MNCEILIVGAGPAGMAVAGRLRKKQMPFEIVEGRNMVAASWHDHYERLSLHTVKELSHLPHLPFPEDYPRYVPREQLISYFNAYQKEFNIDPKFGRQVKFISKREEGYRVSFEGSKYDPIICQHLILATGANRKPHIPIFDQQDSFAGEIIHSKFYKNAEPYRGLRVLVIGMGNSGAEIALDLAENNIETYLSVRGPVNIVPRDLNGRPTQITAKQLEKIPFGLGDKLGTLIRRIYYGDLTKYGLTPSSMPPVVQLKETGKTPVIDIGTIRKIKEGKIKVLPSIESMTSTTAVDEQGQHHEIDQIILATGYRPKLSDLLFSTEDLLDAFGFPKSPIGTGAYQGLYFVGFDNYKLGGILGTIYTDSEKIVNVISEQLRSLSSAPSTVDA